MRARIRARPGAAAGPAVRLGGAASTAGRARAAPASPAGGPQLGAAARPPGRNLPWRRAEAHEIWAFVGAKQRSATQARQGDIWTFTAIRADTKLMGSWLVGPRTPESAHAFTGRVAARLARRVQPTTEDVVARVGPDRRSR